MATARVIEAAAVQDVASIVTARMVEAKRLRRQALQIDEDYFDLLGTYNRMWDASDGRDERLAQIDRALAAMRRQRRRLLDRAAQLLGERR